LTRLLAISAKGGQTLGVFHTFGII